MECTGKLSLLPSPCYLVRDWEAQVFLDGRALEKCGQETSMCPFLSGEAAAALVTGAALRPCSARHIDALGEPTSTGTPCKP